MLVLCWSTSLKVRNVINNNKTISRQTETCLLLFRKCNQSPQARIENTFHEIMMEEEAKKTRAGKGKSKAGESDVVPDVVAPVELELDQHQVELQRC